MYTALPLSNVGRLEKGKGGCSGLNESYGLPQGYQSTISQHRQCTILGAVRAVQTASVDISCVYVRYYYLLFQHVPQSSRARTPVCVYVSVHYHLPACLSVSFVCSPPPPQNQTQSFLLACAVSIR